MPDWTRLSSFIGPHRSENPEFCVFVQATHCAWSTPGCYGFCVPTGDTPHPPCSGVEGGPSRQATSETSRPSLRPRTARSVFGLPGRPVRRRRYTALPPVRAESALRFRRSC